MALGSRSLCPSRRVDPSPAGTISSSNRADGRGFSPRVPRTNAARRCPESRLPDAVRTRQRGAARGCLRSIRTEPGRREVRRAAVSSGDRGRLGRAHQRSGSCDRDAHGSDRAHLSREPSGLCLVRGTCARALEPGSAHPRSAVAACRVSSVELLWSSGRIWYSRSDSSWSGTGPAGMCEGSWSD